MVIAPTITTLRMGRSRLDACGPGTRDSRDGVSPPSGPTPRRAASCTMAMTSDASKGRSPSAPAARCTRARAAGVRIAARPPSSASAARTARTQRGSNAEIAPERSTTFGQSVARDADRPSTGIAARDNIPCRPERYGSSTRSLSGAPRDASRPRTTSAREASHADSTPRPELARCALRKPASRETMMPTTYPRVCKVPAIRTPDREDSA